MEVVARGMVARRRTSGFLTVCLSCACENIICFHAELFRSVAPRSFSEVFVVSLVELSGCASN